RHRQSAEVNGKTMLSAVNGSNQGYLYSLRRIQSAMDTVERQVSSGVRVGRASDDPSVVPAVLDMVSQVALTNQSLSNMNELQVELQTGDSALQQALKLFDEAGAVASQAAGTAPADNAKLSALTAQARDIQQSLVGLSRSSANGRFIFSGDADS